MKYSVTTSVAAPAEAVWAVLADLRSWPSWSPTVESIEAPDGVPVTGMRVRVKQPGRRTVAYTVDTVEPGRRFRWGNAGRGVRQTADHVVTDDGPDASSVVLSFAMTGPLGVVLGALGARTIRRFVEQEAAGLKSRAEA